MQGPIYKCWTKAISQAEPGSIKHSRQWVTSRRAWLMVFEDRLRCGDWEIPFAAISDAVLYKGWSPPWPVQVLELVVGTYAYQFGLNPWCRIQDHLPIVVRTAPLKLGHSAFSLLVRVGFLAVLVFWLWGLYQ